MTERPPTTPRTPRFTEPTVADGAAMWRIANDSRVLDVNSPYAYLLWTRDFAATSIVVRVRDDDIVGFVTGYVRPTDPSVLMIWQVAVDEAARGRGLAGVMLDEVFARTRRHQPLVEYLETTITDDNAPSRALFAAFATRHDAELVRSPLFEAQHFPDGSDDPHAPEVLNRIGPVPH